MSTYQNQYKGSNWAKTVALVVVFILLFAGVGTSLYMVFKDKAVEVKTPAEEADDTQIPATETEEPIELEQTVDNGITLELSPVFLSAPSGNYTTQSVTATITPASIVDKYVTWSIAWDSSASLKNEDISKYLKLESDDQGDLTMRIYCIKSFKGSNIILTCKTRQDNKSGTATIVFKGIPSTISLGSASGATVGTYNLGAMNVNLLYVGNTYNIPISMGNIFNDVGSEFCTYSVTVSGVGTINCGTYVQSPRGRGWSSTSNVINVSDIATSAGFITATVTGNTLKLTINKSLLEYYESVNTQYVSGSGETTTWTNKLYSLNTDSNGNKPYFTITVKQSAYNLTATYKCFLAEQVSSISPNSSTIIF